MRRFFFFQILLTAFITLLIPSVVSAAVQTSITLEQVTPSSLGTWHIIAADGHAWSSEDVKDPRRHSFSITEFSPQTLSVTPTPGMSAKISVYRNGDLVTTTDTPQYSFTPLPNEKYRFLVQYAFSQLGSLGITSIPSGIRFRMTGPTSRTYSGKSPKTFTNIAAGSYTIRFSSTPECSRPAPQTAIVEPGVRSTINATLACNVAEETQVTRSRISKRSIVESVEKREQKPIGQKK